MKTMQLQNLRAHKTNGVITHYTGELVDENDVFPVEFSNDDGTGHITAYNTNINEHYPIDLVNGCCDYDISNWQDGDSIEIYEAINDFGIRML